MSKGAFERANEEWFKSRCILRPKIKVNNYKRKITDEKKGESGVEY